MSLATEVPIKIECKQPKWYLDEEKKWRRLQITNSNDKTNCQLYNIVTKFHSKSRWSLIVKCTRDVSILWQFESILVPC